MLIMTENKNSWTNVVQNWKFMSFRAHRLQEQASPNIEILRLATGLSPAEERRLGTSLTFPILEPCHDRDCL